tara:strand:- start:446 stop:700 length:255 start_codon:yes stop_codon:yes gene_type:complete
MNEKELMSTIAKYAEFLDKLEKDLEVCVEEDERDAEEMTDGTGDILEGRAEISMQIIESIENFRKYLTREYHQVGNDTVYTDKE